MAARDGVRRPASPLHRPPDFPRLSAFRGMPESDSHTPFIPAEELCHVGDLANNVFANIISNAITYLLSLVLLTFLERLVAKAVIARANLLHTNTVVKLLVSASCNVFAYLLFACVFVLVYKQSGWEMGSGATISVIVAGITLLLVSFICFVITFELAASRCCGRIIPVVHVRLHGGHADNIPNRVQIHGEVSWCVSLAVSPGACWQVSIPSCWPSSAAAGAMIVPVEGAEYYGHPLRLCEPSSLYRGLCFVA